MDRLFARQKELEDLSVERGADRFKRRLEEAKTKGRGATHGAGIRLLKEGIEPLELAIRYMIANPGSGRPFTAVRWCKAVGPTVASYLTVKVVLDYIYERVSLRKMAMAIGGVIIDEVRWARFRENASALWDWKIERFHGTDHYGHKRRSLMASMKYASIDTTDLEMTPTERFQVGAKLLDLLMSSTELVKLSHSVKGSSKPSKIREAHHIQATDETLDWLGLRNDAMTDLWPILMPMVVPPLPWTDEQRGGYRNALAGVFPLVRQTLGNSQVEADTSKVVYDAVNSVQGTAWKINGDVLALLQDIEKRGGGYAGVPSFEPTPMPRKPHDIDTDADARRAWSKKAGIVKNSEVARQGKVGDILACMHMAETVADFDSIWFPFNLDFRGRLYPMTTYLHPQGNDFCRALLHFAEAKELGSAGAGWLAVHGANCLGEWQGIKMNRLSVQERADWVIDHSDRIREVVCDPWSDLWWTEAEKPFQFYAFCVEWVGYETSGVGYRSRLPIAQDGTCNGLQHFAALFRDEKGGAAVNMLPSDRPDDLYQRICDAVLDQLELDSAEDEVARLWLSSGEVDRKLCKRPTMTFVYGSKQYGFRSQILEELRSRESWAAMTEHFIIERDGRTRNVLKGIAASYLATLVWEALKQVTVAAFEGMAWMQQGARLAAKVGEVTTWTVPLTGFQVIQRYYKLLYQRVKTHLCGSLVYSGIFNEGEQPLGYRQANAVAPNFIHSLDAAALMLTVNECVKLGVHDFSMIHDSFGTHACDSDTLADVLREQFVRLHDEFIVLDLQEKFLELTATGEEDMPEPPPQGGLDLTQVIDSTYFFS